MKRRDFLRLGAMGATSAALARRASRLTGQEAITVPINDAARMRISDAAYRKAWKRAAAMVAKMTLAEKISQTGNGTPKDLDTAAAAPGKRRPAVWLTDGAAAIPRLGLPYYNYYSGEALHGLCRNGPVTSFPLPLAMACSWNPELALQVYSAVSDEARAYDKKEKVGLAYYSPQTLNLHRDPRWGRSEEAPGEDPCLVGTWSANVVRGMQGDDPNYLKTTACAKHFICYDTCDNSADVSVSPRNFWEYYTRAYRTCAMDADVFTFMTAYTAINGVPCSADRFLLTSLLRERWGFRGYITSDCDAVHNILTHYHYANTLPQAVAVAMKAGCDLNCGDTMPRNLGDAVKDRYVSEADISLAVTRLLTVRMLFGEFDPPERVPYNRIGFDVVDSPTNRQLAVEAARQSIVLLKNDQNFLPLEKSKLKTVAVIGPTAGECFLGGYSGKPFVHISPYAGIVDALHADKSSLDALGLPTVVFKPGCSIQGPKDESMFAEAVEAAKNADVVIMVCGINQEVDAEGRDRKDIALTGVQHDLIQACFQANPKTVLVIASNNTVAVNWEQDNLPAIVSAIFAGQAQGTAIADVLFGNHNPGGKTCCTWYRSVDQLPPFQDYDIMKGRTYMYFEGDPLYPFGYGLSYTQFEFSNLKLSRQVVSQGETVKISARVTNTGSRDGAEVAQLYVTAPKSPVKRPIKQLVGFRRLELKAGESKTVTFALPYNEQALWYWHEGESKFVLQPGTLKVMIGNSSSHIDLQSEIRLESCTDDRMGRPETLAGILPPPAVV